MRKFVRKFEARWGIGELSREGMQGWGAVVAGHTTERWPPLDWSSSAGVAQGEGAPREERHGLLSRRRTKMRRP